VLRNFLRFDPKHIQEVVQEAYSPNPLIAQGYFLPLVEVCEEKELVVPLSSLLNLVFFKIGEHQLQSRKAASQLLAIVCKMKYFKGSIIKVPSVTLVSEEYLQQQCITSFKVGHLYVYISLTLLRLQHLTLILPWKY
jgi:hypothetical protein